jgi:SNF2 family DNA or RNA helicase
MVWFDLPWSFELYQQTVARLYRQGQKSKTVRVYRILCAGTIDERIAAALQEKDVGQRRLLGAVKAEPEP